MELKVSDMLNLDLDWFVIINDTPIHVASDGTMLPNFIVSHFDQQKEARKEILKIKEYIKISDIQINPDLPLLSGVLNYAHEYNLIVEAYDEYKGRRLEQDQEKYANLQKVFNFGNQFKNMENEVKLREYLARIYVPEFLKFGVRGFISFDHTYGEDTKDNFHWVVKPKVPISEEISKLKLPSFKLNEEDDFTSLFSDKSDLVSLVNKYI